jgi:hypothetical protein
MNGDDGMIITDVITSECIGKSASFAINDFPWKFFGFNGCPKRGRLFNVFVAQSKLDKENFFLREFFCLHLGLEMQCVFNNSRLQSRFPNKPDELRGAILSLLSSNGVSGAFHFDNESDALNYLLGHTQDYALSSTNDAEGFGYIFLQHAKEARLSNTQPIILMGQAMPFFAVILSMIKKNMRLT